MNNQINRHLALFLFVFLLLPVMAQEKKPNPVADNTMHSNAIYTNFGLGIYFATATLNYERMLKQNMWNRHISSYVKAGGGVFDSWDGPGRCIQSQFGMMTGAKKRHLEASAGIFLYHYPDRYFYGPGNTKNKWLTEDPLPSVYIGYRHQKPNGHFIFKTGLGFPGGLSFSFGGSF